MAEKKGEEKKGWGRLKRWGWEAVLLVLILTGVHLWQTRNLADGDAPSLAGTTLGGRSFELSRLEGPMLVHFWATWCPVCRAQEGNVARLAEGYSVLTVAMQSGTEAEVGDYLAQEGLSFATLNDLDGTISRRWGVSAVPTSFIIDQQGRVSYHSVGYTTYWGLRLRLMLAGL